MHATIEDTPGTLLAGGKRRKAVSSTGISQAAAPKVEALGIFMPQL